MFCIYRSQLYSGVDSKTILSFETQLPYFEQKFRMDTALALTFFESWFYIALQGGFFRKLYFNYRRSKTA